MEAKTARPTLKCDPCSLKIEPEGNGYRYAKPGVVVPTKLQNYKVLENASKTRRCPLCGLEMTVESGTQSQGQE